METLFQEEGYTLQKLQYDNGSELISKELDAFLASRGIEPHLSLPYTKEQNGLSERHNGLVLTLERSLRCQSRLPKKYWPMSVRTAVHLKNLTATTALPANSTPFELIHGKKANIASLRTFGCEALVKIPNEKLSKGDLKARRCIFLGYAQRHEGWIFLDIETWKIVISGRATFNEHNFPAVQSETSEEIHKELEVSTHPSCRLPKLSMPTATAANNGGTASSTSANAPESDAATPSSPLPANPDISPKPDASGPFGNQPTDTQTDAEVHDGHHEPASQPSHGPIAQDASAASNRASSTDQDEGPLSSVFPDVTATTTTRQSMRTNRGVPPVRFGLDPEPQRTGVGENDINTAEFCVEDDTNAIFSAFVEVTKSNDFTKTYLESMTESVYALTANPTTGEAKADTRPPPTVPKSVKQALASPYKKEWLEAMHEEYQRHKKHCTYTKVQKPSKNTRVLRTMWVFDLKRSNETGEIYRFKARWVCCGNRMKKGIDFDETYAAVMKMKVARAIIAIAIHHGLPLFSVDIKTAYLNADIDKELYVNLPEGFTKPGSNEIGRLNRCLYGTPQAGRLYWLKISKTLRKLGFKETKSEPCLYVKKDKGKKPMFVGVYVDDLEIAATPEQKEWLIKGLTKEGFDIKDLGELNEIIGLSVRYDLKAGEAHISQPALIQKIIKACNLDSSTGDTKHVPMQPGLKLWGPPPSESKRTPLQQKEFESRYRSILGMVLYLAMGSRPDIAFAVSFLARFASNPDKRHWNAMKSLVKYLKGTPTHGILFTKQDNEISFDAFCDADWATDESDRKSVSGYMIRAMGGPLCWQSSKQKCIALSTMESALISLCTTTTEVLWWRNLMREVGLLKTEPTSIHEDNQACIAWVTNNGSPGRCRHIDLRKHFVREVVGSRKVKLVYVPSADNLADIYTKPLPRPIFSSLRDRIGVQPAPS